MTLSRSFDLLVSLLAAAIWGLAIAAIGTHFVSTSASGLLGLGVAFSGVALVLSGHFRELQLESLLRGACPRCHQAVRHEHQHRRWDPAAGAWTSPSATWECSACGYNHTEGWDCPDCRKQK